MARFLGAGLVATLAATLVPLSAAGATVLPDPVPFDREEFGVSPGHTILWGTDAELARDLDQMAEVGATWLRVDFDWSAVQNGGRNSWSWGAIDRVVSAAQARGLRILALVTYSPSWARPAGTDSHYGLVDPADYARFADAAVRRYGPQGVKHWEIWNEPNISPFFKPKPDPQHYVQLLNAASAAIRAADSSAVVLTGGTSPATDSGDGSWVAPVTFLRKVYENGGGGKFDAVAHHPYSFPWSPTAGEWSAFVQSRYLYDLMVANGDAGKKIWGTEFGFPTGTSSQAVDETTQAVRMTEVLAGWRDYSFHGPLLWFDWRDEGTNPAVLDHNFGLVHNDGSPKPAVDILRASLAAPVGDPQPDDDPQPDPESTVQPSPEPSPQPSAQPRLRARVGSVRVTEGDRGVRRVRVPVRLSSAAPTRLTLTYSLSTPGGRWSTERSDFRTAGGRVTFAPGSTRAYITVAIRSDRKHEGNERLHVKLSPAGDVRSVFRGSVVIVDDD